MPRYPLGAGAGTGWTGSSGLGWVVLCAAVVVVLVVLGWVLAFRDGFHESAADYPFNFHPVLMVVAYVGFETQGIAIFALNIFDHGVAKSIHVMCHTFALLCLCGGVYAVLSFHNAKAIANFYSLHSWLGILQLLFFVVQFVVSAAVYLGSLVPLRIKQLVMPYHRLSGLVLYFVALGVCALGILEKQTFLQTSGTVSHFSTDSMLINTAGVLMCVLAALVVLLIFRRHQRVLSSNQDLPLRASLENIQQLDTEMGDVGAEFSSSEDEAEPSPRPDHMDNSDLPPLSFAKLH